MKKIILVSILAISASVAFSQTESTTAAAGSTTPAVSTPAEGQKTHHAGKKMKKHKKTHAKKHHATK